MRQPAAVLLGAVISTRSGHEVFGRQMDDAVAVTLAAFDELGLGAV